MEEGKKKTKTLISKMIGKEVTLVIKKSFEKNLFSVVGNCVGLTPNVIISLKFKYYGIGFNIFGGVAEGIYQIIDKDEKILYENKCVLDEYKSQYLEKEGKPDEKKMQSIKNQGIWYFNNL